MKSNNCVCKKYTLKLFILLLIFIASIFASLLFGAQKLNLSEIISHGTFSNLIFMQIRLPRTLLALIAGLLLSGSGAVFQMYFRNPLAEPGIMGISAGATLGASVSVSLAGVTAGISISTGAFAGALIAGVLVTIIASSKGGASGTVALLLCGTALGSLYSAITSILIYSDDSTLRSLYVWMLGTFNGRGWSEVKFILLPSVLAVALFAIVIRPLDLLNGGETAASSLGVNVKRLRLGVIIAGSLATSAAVCAGGTIGFVGLIAPHIVRKIFGAKGKTLLPLSMITGAVLLLLSDTVARTVAAPSELPVGTITALIGAPFFISLLFSKRGAKNV